MSSLGAQIQILNPGIPRGRIRHVLFDFDGTLSLIRQGWQDVMIPMMVEILREPRTGETEDELEQTVREYVTRLTGKQTIYQMIELADQVRRRGGVPRDPLEYKHEYLHRLEARIACRVHGLADRRLDPDALLIPGARAMLDELQRRGMTLYLASGTDEPYVLREAGLLGIGHYFAGRIYGAIDDYQRYSKKRVIDRIIRTNQFSGPELLGIGDGYVEIENTKAVGGIALGVASRETDPTDFDLWKKERLAAAGADLLVPNFRELDQILAFLFET